MKRVILMSALILAVVFGVGAGRVNAVAFQCQRCNCGCIKVGERCLDTDACMGDTFSCVPSANTCVKQTVTVEPSEVPIACSQCQAGVFLKSEGNAVRNGVCNSVIDIEDFLDWSSHYLAYQTGTPTPVGGWGADFNCDRAVDISDFLAWSQGYLRNHGMTATPGAPTNTPAPVATNTPVPAATNTPVPTATSAPACTADGLECRGDVDCCSGDCNNFRCGSTAQTGCPAPQTNPHSVELPQGVCQEVAGCGYNDQFCL